MPIHDYTTLGQGPYDPTPSMEDQFAPAEDMIDALSARVSALEQVFLQRAADSYQQAVPDPVDEPDWEPEDVFDRRRQMARYHLRKIQMWCQVPQTGVWDFPTVNGMLRLGLDK